MGQKVNPIGLRLGINRTWDSTWYADKKYAELLHEDLKLRKYVKNRLFAASVSRIQIERAANRIRITIHTARPGMVIGRGGAEADALRKDLEKMTGKQVSVNILEVKHAETDAQLIAENIASQLERRISFRRAMKQAMMRAERLGAQGIRMKTSGRLGGAEIARTEGYSSGKLPLHTLRADIDYGFTEAKTTYGKIGVKVWVYKGEVLPTKVRDRRQGGGAQ
ncbi:MAG: 30S ribosomal protein S3 [Clostridiales bacterium]|nr:30S ribosomal protein S3 [Clostridiales bacterium]